MSVDTTLPDAALDAASVAETDAADTAAATDLSESAITTVADVAETEAPADAAPDADPAATPANTTTTTAATDTATAGTAAVLDTGTEVTFASLDLPAPLLGVLDEAGVTTAFPIQAATIPDALIGRDVLGRGRTGSGKTLAFGLPTLTRLEGLRAKPRRPLALVLVPTRELAMQVEEALRPYARALRLRIRSVYGGAPMRKQIDGLRYGVELLVATPGRLSDLIERGECELDEVDVAILDEADQMCDMGFLPHVCELMDQVAEGGQRLLFSATLDGAVDEIVKKYMKDPVLHEVDPQAGAVTTMSHHLLLVTPQHKAKVAAQIAGRHSAEGNHAETRSIFFVRTQMAVDRVTEQLRERGLPAAGLHGGMNQVARTKTLEDFKEGRTPVLIATDVAARGIHVDGIDLVVHLDPARDSKDYLHRAGRTARAGQAGVVASLILPKQRKQAQRLMDDAGVTAEELDAAPLGSGPKWESAGSALAELTGAREVPEPGDVTPFTLPVSVRERERPSRYGERREGDGYNRDRYNRDDRRGGSRFGGEGSRSGGSSSSGSSSSYVRRDGDRYERPNRDDRRSAAPDRGFANRDGAQPARDGRDEHRAPAPEGGFARRDGQRPERDNRDERPGAAPEGAAERRVSERPERDERRGAMQDRGFARRDGERGGRDFGRDERPGRTFERRDDNRRDRDRDGYRGGAPSAGRNFEGRGPAGRSFEDRGSQRRGFEGRGFEGRSSDGPRSEGGHSNNGRFEKRGFEKSGEKGGFEKRGFDGRGTGGRSFKERSGDGRSWSERSDRGGSADRSGHTDRPGYSDRPGYADRSGHGERFGRDDRRGASSRPRSDWDRGKKQPYTSRDGKPRP